MAYKRKWFSKEDIELIKKIGAEHHLMTALKFNYKLSTSKEMNETLAKLYNDLADIKPLSPNWFCGHCALGNYRAIAQKYYASLEKRGIAEGEEDENTEEKTDSETVENNEVQIPEGE